MNPLPDLKVTPSFPPILPAHPSTSCRVSCAFAGACCRPQDKQLAVLEMRLYGIRDMPTFREPVPLLPQSVIGERNALLLLMSPP